MFEWPVRVYYEDTDTGGVVYYANYLKYLERARTEWLRDLGFGQDALMRDSGISKASLTFVQRIVRAPDTVLSRATVKVACLDSDRFRPTAIPANIREKLKHAHE